MSVAVNFLCQLGEALVSGCLVEQFLKLMVMCIGFVVVVV